jgi:BirA family biotin operon repressor/biotin-[acetyl-CoA-carboxylase] ligase
MMDTRIIHLDETASTQDVAAASYEGSPLLVVADRQTRGRGRRSRTWENAPRSLAMSLAFEPEWAVEAWSRLALVTGVSVASQFEGARLKWPNDVLLDGSKIAGILAEVRGDFVVVGVGVNLWWPGAPPGYGATFDQDPGAAFGIELAREITDDFFQRVLMGPDDWGLDRYRDLCGTIGKDITWEPAGQGHAVGVADSGALVVDTHTGTKELFSGEVRHVRNLG